MDVDEALTKMLALAASEGFYIYEITIDRTAFVRLHDQINEKNTGPEKFFSADSGWGELSPVVFAGPGGRTLIKERSSK